MIQTNFQSKVGKRWGALVRPLALGLSLLLAVSAAANPITDENKRAGDRAWELDNPAFHREIEGYASETSVQGGNTFKLMLSADDAQCEVDVYRIGWYGGVGGRLVNGPVTVNTSRQATGTPDPTTGYLDANWPVTTTVKVPRSGWASGFYLVKVTGLTSGYQCYVPFVVRESNRSSDLLFTSGVLTYAAYDFWGGQCFYSGPRATRISLNRPYERSYGGGDFLNWEIQMVRFLEREGYDVTYQTDIDLHHGRNFHANHKALLFVGHDEYWTSEMRQYTEYAKTFGQSIGNFASNTCYWQVRLEPDAGGNSDRTVVCYKYDAAASDPYALKTGSYYKSRITTTWRDPILNKPEAALFGTEYMGDPFYGDMTVTNANHWAFKNSGLTNGSVLTGLLGYEVDKVDTASPSGITVLASEPTTFGASSMAVYTTPAGGTVFSTGSMQWSWGLDAYGTAWLWPQPNYVSPAAQQITRNVLYKLITRRNP